MEQRACRMERAPTPKPTTNMNRLKQNYTPIAITKKEASAKLKAMSFLTLINFFGMRIWEFAKALKCEANQTELYNAMTLSTKRFTPERLALRFEGLQLLDEYIEFWLNQAYGADAGEPSIKVGTYTNVPCYK